jgi:hypothetical protein
MVTEPCHAAGRAWPTTSTRRRDVFINVVPTFLASHAIRRGSSLSQCLLAPPRTWRAIPPPRFSDHAGPDQERSERALVIV